MSEIRVAIAGVGNCASSLVQGTHFYADLFAQGDMSAVGLARPVLAGYAPGDLNFVAAIDIDLSAVEDLIGHPGFEALEADLEDGRPDGRAPVK